MEGPEIKFAEAVIDNGRFGTRTVRFETGRLAAEWHEDVFNVLMAMVVLHILAIAWYRLVKKEKLVEAMIHGTRAYPQDLPPVQHASLLRLVVGIVLASGFAWAVACAFEF